MIQIINAMKLEAFGWSDFFADSFRFYAGKVYTVGRIYLEHKGIYWLYTEMGEISAEIAGKMRYVARKREDLPAVGDWAVIQIRENERKATIYGILPRKSKFSRKTPGAITEEQIVAANIDTVMLVSGLDNDFNPRRIERYITMAQSSGAEPVIVLNKADVCEYVEQRLSEVEQIAHGILVVLISAIQDNTSEVLLPFISKGQTVALLGSSGVGKSTITNRLLGRERQEVQEVRVKDSCGRHTTTNRELLILPNGGLIIDTPGMRELQLWTNDEELHTTFEDIEILAQQCYFSNCQHSGEIGCAVTEALENGNLNSARLNNYNKMQRELAYLLEKQDFRAAQMKKEKVKKITHQFNKNKKRW